MRIKISFLCLAFVLVAASLFADTITLKSGKEIEGTILEKTDDSVKIEAYGAQTTYFMDEVDKINSESILPVQESGTAGIQAEDISVTTESVQTEVQPGEMQTESLPEEMQSENMPEQPQEATTLSVAGQPIEKVSSSSIRDHRKAMLAAGVIFVMAIFALLVYIYASLCLQLIAKKTNQGPVWLAWVPVGNLFLMCKIASLDYKWLLGYLLTFIPLVGVIFGLAINGYLWYRIALVRNQPGWLGILACLPLVNLVIMGYLAFSD